MRNFIGIICVYTSLILCACSGYYYYTFFIKANDFLDKRHSQGLEDTKQIEYENIMETIHINMNFWGTIMVFSLLLLILGAILSYNPKKK
jgi:hypothetical protein